MVRSASDECLPKRHRQRYVITVMLPCMLMLLASLPYPRHLISINDDATHSSLN